MSTRCIIAGGWLLLFLGQGGPMSAAAAQPPDSARAELLATAEAALEAISQEDMVALTDLMIEEAVIVPVRERDGEATYAVRTRAEERSRPMRSDIIERGFDAEVRIAGPMAMVWLPYDLYIDGEWSHCGVDVFTLLRIEGRWRIATMAWSVEQPPACRRHPDGPPR